MNSFEFKPAWWLPNPHLQTLWPVLLRREVKNLQLIRERIELPDTDFIDLDWLGKNETGPLVVVLHGMEGSIDSHYAKGVLLALQQHGWRSVFMHFRGCSEEPNRLHRAYHSGDTGDLAYLVSLLKEREPHTPLAAVGYSLGGNVLLKWLGETGKHNPLRAAIAISVPFELNKAAKRIQEGFSKLYQWHLLKCLRTRLSKKYQDKEAGFLLEALSLLPRIQTLRDFDNLFTARLHGFTDADQYYSMASSRQYLSHIEVPTLIIHAKDDPFMTADSIPEAHELSGQVTLEVTANGGHLGFVAGKYPWKPNYWLEERIPRFFTHYLAS